MKNQIFKRTNLIKLISRLRWLKPDKLLKTARQFKNLKYLKPLKESTVFKVICAFFTEYWHMCHFIAVIAYLELLYRLWNFNDVSTDYLFPFLFALSAGAALYLLIGLVPAKATGIVTVVVTAMISLCYGLQLIYFRIFRTPLSLISLGGAGDALQFWDIIIEAILKNTAAVVLIFIPLIMLLMRNGRLTFSAKKPLAVAFVLLFCVSSYSIAIVCVNLTGDSPVSQNTLYYKASSPELSVTKLGLLTTMRLDLERLVAGALQNSYAGKASQKKRSNNDNGTEGTSADGKSAAVQESGNPGAPGTAAATESEGNIEQDEVPASSKNEMPSGGDGYKQNVPTIPRKLFNTMDIDFDTLLASEKVESNYAMHKYFSTVKPTATNQYTGMFKGNNLVLLTAEGFSQYVISPELTPTLYKMATEGFVFKNFYNPVWWVSTSDGEYVACTGLLPKSGVWSFAYSGKNYMPFAMGNQFNKLGYSTKAYHNHTYSYYKRDISHPNLGYDYKGIGNGLVMKKTWPRSDLEMINVTAGEYIGQKPFHTYYLTISGHMNYSFLGNQMAEKNRELVADLPYSETSKAYIASNLELEFAMKALIEKLEAAGAAENTVIAISADHYPYGLPKENLDELAGHEVENNFELYKSIFILWKKGMTPIIINKPSSSLDIIPTLSNLFGLEYDSRLLMGSDILSDAPTLVIFSNRSWITDRAIYNSAADVVTFTDGTVEDKDYIKRVNRIVADKFKYSEKILETDYYRKVLQ